jgi:MOSC domain-containing protein YiiM
VFYRDADGRVTRKAGIMGIVRRGGAIRAGDRIRVDLPDGPHLPPDRV